MAKVKVTLPDGTVKEYPKGIALSDVTRDAGTPEALVAKVDGVLQDLTSKLDHDAQVESVTFEQPEGRQV
ncbi:MAG TPA: TGS domain-containing protein, partial [bacterium]|nr:TGS domain-containing protein [bacterium]